MSVTTTSKKITGRILAAVMLFFFLIGSTGQVIDEALEPIWRNANFDDLPPFAPPQPSTVLFSNLVFPETGEPMMYLFQLMMILFVISPPLIVVMLFLIWKELKKRNDLR